MLCGAPVQPCLPGGLPPPPTRNPHSAWLPRAALGGGLRGRELSSPWYPSPLHFNTALHLRLVCTAQNVPSIISVCTFATVCASCALKAIKSSFVCLQGNRIFFFPSLDKPVLAQKNDTNHPCKPWACLGSWGQRPWRKRDFMCANTAGSHRALPHGSACQDLRFMGGLKPAPPSFQMVPRSRCRGIPGHTAPTGPFPSELALSPAKPLHPG